MEEALPLTRAAIKRLYDGTEFFAQAVRERGRRCQLVCDAAALYAQYATCAISGVSRSAGVWLRTAGFPLLLLAVRRMRVRAMIFNLLYCFLTFHLWVHQVRGGGCTRCAHRRFRCREFGVGCPGHWT